MAEKENVFSSKIKYDGVVLFKDFYKFCYEWLKDETELDVAETKYTEKIAGPKKDIDIEWIGTRKVTDYFKFQIKATFRILGLENVETTQNGVKLKTNQGSVEVKISGTLIRDYDGKFEVNSNRKFMRSIYEKWVIPSRIQQFEDKLISDCDEFLSQAKAYLDLEGKR
ncbi:hypothetical protein KAI04_04625 [Candidatus Pacearchaeota archaeon]|nr:hypothetical protein [Candidatus Pacearchaeota archaeon]